MIRVRGLRTITLGPSKVAGPPVYLYKVFYLAALPADGGTVALVDGAYWMRAVVEAVEPIELDDETGGGVPAWQLVIQQEDHEDDPGLGREMIARAEKAGWQRIER